MKKVYTCYVCGFPFVREEEACPEYCPACNAPKDQFLSEPFNGSIDNRRIHVDFPKPDPNWDPMNISYHHPKHFKAYSRHGRLRRFVLGYNDPEITRKFYEEVFDWDIINTEHADPDLPLMYCATGPGNPNWEPSVPSFGYGFLKAKAVEDTGSDPRFMVEVDDIEEALKKTVEYGGRVLKERYEVEGQAYAVVEDSEGNAMYYWQTPDTVTWKEPESQYLSQRQQKQK